MTREFGVLDYIVLSVVLVASLGIGFYFACFGGKQKTSKEYFKGDGNMNIVPVVLSMLATYLSTNGMLGIPAEIYTYGFNYWFTWMGSILGVPIAVYGYMSVFYRLQITSIYEYIERRFNKTVRMCGSVMTILTMLIYTSFVTYGPALALSQVTGLSVWGSILTTTIIGTVYTSIGGIKAVMWTDSLQVVIFLVAVIAAIVKGCIDVGGVGVVIERAISGGRLNALSFSVDPRVRYTFWGIFINSTLAWCAAYGASQVQVQRYLSCPNKKVAQRSVFINAPSLVAVGGVYCFIGLTLYAKYWNCDPLTSQQIKLPDQIFPLFVMDTMSSLPGMCGLFVAGVYSASLSTTSSILNSLAAVTLEDHIKPRWKNLTDEKATFISKFIAVAYGILSLVVIAAIKNLGSIIQAINYLMGGTNGANFGLFTLGFMVPWANSKGTILGIVSGVGLAWWVAVGNQIYRPISKTLPLSVEDCDNVLGEWSPRQQIIKSDEVFDLYKISYFWIIPLAWFTTVFVGAISSLFIGSKEVYDVKLLSPFARIIMKKFFKKKLKEMQINFHDSINEDKVTLPCLDRLTLPTSNEEIENLTENNSELHPKGELINQITESKA